MCGSLTQNVNILLMQKAANQKQKHNQMLLCRIDNDFNLTEPLAEYVSMAEKPPG